MQPPIVTDNPSFQASEWSDDRSSAAKGQRVARRALPPRNITDYPQMDPVKLPPVRPGESYHCRIDPRVFRSEVPVNIDLQGLPECLRFSKPQLTISGMCRSFQLPATSPLLNLVATTMGDNTTSTTYKVHLPMQGVSSTRDSIGFLLEEWIEKAVIEVNQALIRRPFDALDAVPVDDAPYPEKWVERDQNIPIASLYSLQKVLHLIRKDSDLPL